MKGSTGGQGGGLAGGDAVHSCPRKLQSVRAHGEEDGAGGEEEHGAGEGGEVGVG